MNSKQIYNYFVNVKYYNEPRQKKYTIYIASIHSSLILILVYEYPSNKCRDNKCNIPHVTIVPIYIIQYVKLILC
jgi:hypothetical protein